LQFDILGGEWGEQVVDELERVVAKCW